MARDGKTPSRLVGVPDDLLGNAGYQPVRPEGVADIPPENLPPPSGDSCMTAPEAPAQDQSSDDGSDS